MPRCVPEKASMGSQVVKHKWRARRQFDRSLLINYHCRIFQRLGSGSARFATDKPDAIVRYDVGPGSIVGWEHEPNEPEPEDEIFCHWISA